MDNAVTKFALTILVCATTTFLGGCSETGDSSFTDASETSTASAADPEPTSGNSAPNVSGSPATVAVVGVNWSFTPNASDVDGDVLTFSIVNRPDWAAFDTATGQLSGAPRLGDSAVYEDIMISVSDGELMASLPAFDINVSQVANGSTTLTWSAPTMNSDGTPLTDLASYRIYYGFSAGSYPNAINVDNPGVTSYVVENLPPATYYFVTTSVNSSGIESAFSNVASTSVN